MPTHLHLYKSLSSIEIHISPPFQTPSHFSSTATSSEAVPKWLSVPGVTLEVPATDPAHVRLLCHTWLVLPLPHHSHGF